MEGDWGNQSEPSALDFVFDGAEFSPADLGGGEVVDKEGWYHFEIQDVKNELESLTNRGEPKSPSVCLHMMVLETVEGQSPAGSRYYHRIYVGGKNGEAASQGAVKSALRLGLGLGILAVAEKDGREVIVDKTTGETKIPATVWQRARGMQCIARIALEKGDGKFKDKYAIPFGKVYQVDDPHVADVPKNQAALAAIGKAGAAGGTPAMQGSPASSGKAAAAAKPAAPADDDFADL